MKNTYKYFLYSYKFRTILVFVIVSFYVLCFYSFLSSKGVSWASIVSTIITVIPLFIKLRVWLENNISLSPKYDVLQLTNNIYFVNITLARGKSSYYIPDITCRGKIYSDPNCLIPFLPNNKIVVPSKYQKIKKDIRMEFYLDLDDNDKSDIFCSLTLTFWNYNWILPLGKRIDIPLNSEL